MKSPTLKNNPPAPTQHAMTRQVATPAEPPAPQARKHSNSLELRIRKMVLTEIAKQAVREGTTGWTRARAPKEVARAMRAYHALPDWHDLLKLEIELTDAPLSDAGTVSGIVVEVLHARPDFRTADHRDYALAVASEISALAGWRNWSDLVIPMGMRWASDEAKFKPQICEVIDACERANKFLRSAITRTRLLGELVAEIEDFLVRNGAMEVDPE